MAAKSGPPDQIFRCGACDHVTLPGPHAWPTRYTALRGRIRMGLCALFLLIIAASVAEGRGSDDGCPTAPVSHEVARSAYSPHCLILDTSLDHGLSIPSKV